MRAPGVVAMMAVGAVVAVGGISGRPAAAASTQVSTDKEAWYNTAPHESCGAACGPILGGLPAAASPYPPGTLHVGIQGGTQTAITYLSLAFPSEGAPTSGTLLLPLSSEPGDGAMSAEAAQFIACAVTEEFHPTEGAVTEPPPARCADDAPPASYDSSAASFRLDISPLLDGLVDGSIEGIALVPAAAAAQNAQTWHVVFDAKSREGGRPITADMTFADASTSRDPVVGPSGETESFPSTGNVDLGDLSPPPAASPAISGPSTPVEATVEPTSPALLSGTSVVRYQLIWAVPLLICAGCYWGARLMTRDLAPATLTLPSKSSRA